MGLSINNMVELTAGDGECTLGQLREFMDATKTMGDLTKVKFIPKFKRGEPGFESITIGASYGDVVEYR